MKKFWVIPVCWLLVFTAGCHPGMRDRPPNIILVVADDLGYGGIGCYGNKDIHTPNLDRLAEQGIRFTDFHSNGAVCTPTRAALLSGQYQQRSGLEGVIYVRGATRGTGMDTSVVTIAEVLKHAGYRTAVMGKWHLGYRAAYNPVNQGFDEFYGYRSGNIDYHTHYDNAGIYDWYHNLDTLVEEGYATDLITRHAIGFIEENKDAPFFLYIAHEAPHVPFQGRTDPGYRYPDREFSYFGPVPDRERAYRDMVEAMDEGMGDILKKLKGSGLSAQTLLFFISDNGGLAGYGDNGGLRGAKTSLFEGGHRNPAIACWQGKIPVAVSGDFIMGFDLFPTVLSICGIAVPGNLPLDGVDLSPVLFGRQKLGDRDAYWRYGGQKAVRSGNLKMVIAQNDTLLFDLSRDPGEQHDLCARQPEKVAALAGKLAGWENEMARYPLKTE